MNNEKEISDCIILSNDFPLPKENEKIKFLKFFDLSSKKVFTFVQHEEQYFIVLSKKMFGSAFFGNLVISNPKYLIIQKFDTLILLINILYVCGAITSKGPIDKDAIISAYMEQIEKQKKNEEKKDKENNRLDKTIIYDNYKEETRNFIAGVINHNIDKLNIISEITKNEEETYSLVLVQSKVYEYLNSKINLNENDKEEIKNTVKGPSKKLEEKQKEKTQKKSEESKPTENPQKNLEEMGQIENDQKELERRKLEEKCEIIGQFLPQEFFTKYMDYKGININPKEQLSNEQNEPKKKANKSQNKTNKKKKAEKQNEIPRGQQTINFYMKKKE